MILHILYLFIFFSFLNLIVKHMIYLGESITNYVYVGENFFRCEFIIISQVKFGL